MIVISCRSLSILHGSILSLDYEPVAICLGSVIFPTNVAPHLHIYYKGKKLTIDTHSKEKEFKLIPYSLEEKKSTQQFHMIICSECKIASKDNTVQYLYVPYTVPYKFYTLTAARQYNQDQEVDGYLWTSVEERLLEKNIIPDGTIIFLFNSDLIDGLNIKSWPQDSSARILPEIIIKKTSTHDDLLAAINAACLAAPDLDAIHKRHTTCVKQINQKAVLSMKS